jgi:membrane protein
MKSQHFLRRLWRELVEDSVADGAAALAFYLVLALFPGAIFAISVVPYLPVPHLQQAVVDLTGQVLPDSAAQVVTKSVQTVASGSSSLLLAFALLFAMWSASSGLAGVMNQLNVIYDVKETRSFLRIRAIAALLALAFCGLSLSALSLAVFGGMLQAHIGERLGWSDTLLMIFASFRWVVIVTALHFAFTLVYYLGPNVKHPFRWVTPGSLFATVGLLVASLALKLYVARYSSFDALYGGLGAVIVLLVWLFLAGWVTLVGGEIDATRQDGPRRRHARRDDVSSASSAPAAITQPGS